MEIGRLAGAIRKRFAAQVQPDDVRARRRGDGVANRDGQHACDNFSIMSPAAGKRLRGWFLRLALNRTWSIVLGLILLAPALWLFFGEYAWETPVTDGLQLVFGATGAALLFAGIGGRRPDWIDREDGSRSG